MGTVDASGRPLLGPAAKFVSIEHWPVVVARLPATATDDDYRLVLAGFDAAYATERPFLGIVDTRALTVAPTPVQRKLLTDWGKRMSPRTERVGLGTAYVVENPVIRAALTALSWLFEQPTPTIYVGTMDEALEFAAAQLRDRGIAMPSGLDELRRTGKT